MWVLFSGTHPPKTWANHDIDHGGIGNGIETLCHQLADGAEGPSLSFSCAVASLQHN